MTLEKVDGDHASWRAGGGARAARALRLAGYSRAQLACVGPGGHVGPCELATAPACQGLQVPKTEGPGDLGPPTWTPWEAGRGQSWGKLPKALALKVFRPCPCRKKKNCTCSPRALSGPCPSLIPWGPAALLPSRCQCLSDPTVPDFPNQRCAKGSREAHPWPLWISAIVTWMGSHSFRAEPYTSLAQFTVSCAGRLCS